MHDGILFADLYQFTMAQVYFRAGLQDHQARFEHYFRSYPDYGEHQAGYCINAGLAWLLQWMQAARLDNASLQVLSGLRGRQGETLLGQEFLRWLRAQDGFASLTLRAIPEGRVVHPHVPLTVVQGPLAMAQLLESSLLNHLNYPILVATKAARIRQSGRGRPLLEFGMRRAHESGANAGTRAALIGGADFSSNVCASARVGTAPQGTHGHSLVQVFVSAGGSELDAFRAFAEVYPDDCVLLVDTVDTLGSGVPNAIRVFEELRRKGHAPAGIRLDSGDLAYLAIQAARMLDRAGFPEVAIVLSNQLDELILLQIVTQIQEEASRYGVDADSLIGRLVFGVGSHLVTSKGAPSLDGVYKLVSLRHGADWKPAIKFSETPAKGSDPGHKEAWRLYDGRGIAVADLMSLPEEDPRVMEPLVLYHVSEPDTHRSFARAELTRIEPLLEDVVPASIEEMRRRRDEDLDRLDPGVRRIVNPHVYHVSVTEGLRKLKRRLTDPSRSPRPAREQQ
jgi:nicotinate phosphoribosyltransferase